MAQEHSTAASPAAWTKIFSAFKIALDMKKLLLAAVGIFLAALGWWVLAWAFYSMRDVPDWEKDYDKPEKSLQDRKMLWAQFKAKRNSWNLLHELAGPPSDHEVEGPADVAETLDEYLLLHKWDIAVKQLGHSIFVKEKKLEVPSKKWTYTLIPLGDAKEAEAVLQGLEKKKLTLAALSVTDKEEKEGDKTLRLIVIDGVSLRAEGAAFDKLKEYRDEAWRVEDVPARAAESPDQAVAKKALKSFQARLARPKTKVAGLMRQCPWSENRGDNPYLIVAKAIKTKGESLFGGGRFFAWMLSEEMPVLLEPLYKFLTPLVYFFDHRAGGWDRLYLILVMIWTLTIWGFFGGAICRIAAVQVAKNERITLREAIGFTRERFVSYLAAPVFPMLLVGIFTLVLMLFGWFIWIPWLGEFFGGLLWPLVLMLGFTMAIVLVGLIGWPLMTATISTEGTDSFDALSRSYSYVYQAPWQFLWYNLLAIVYGAVLVFFVGFMASLMVFLGKWGVATAVGPADADPKVDREPSYLFYYAPRSFGWRDLLISSSPFTVVEKGADGHETREFTPEYEAGMSGFNRFGAGFVALWIYPLFLLVVGFGYSYFWTSATIIYFLMRRCVDDTEMDEVHQEDEDFDDPFLKPTPPPPAEAPAGKPGTVSLNVVEAPPKTSYTADDHPPTPPPPAAT